MEAISLKRRHLGIAGIITLLLQYGIGKQTEKSAAEAVNDAMRAQLQIQRFDIERTIERDFVRRDALATTVADLSRKIDGVSNKVDQLTSKAAWIEGYLRKTRGLEVSAHKERFDRQDKRIDRLEEQI